MSPMIDPLDALIVRIRPEDRDRRWGNGRVLYTYDPVNGTAKPYRKRFFEIGAADYGYYLVTKDEHVVCAPIEVELKDANHQMRLVEIVVALRGVAPGRSEDLVVVLATHRHPSEALVTAIRGYLEEFVRDRRAARIDVVGQLSLPDVGPKTREECALFLKRRAELRLGLLVECSIRLPEDDLKLENLVIERTVFVRDSEEELALRLELSIHPPESADARHRAVQQILSPQRLRDSIEHRTVRWFRDACTLDEVCHHPTTVRAGLEKRLRDYVEGELSRVLFHFRLTCTPQFSPTVRIREDYEVECKVEPGQTTVPVHHKVMVRCIDIAKFRAARIENLQQWMDDLLTQRTRAVLFSKTYAEILLDFDDIEAEIKRDVERAAAEIGFRVDQLITIPADEQMRSYLARSLSFDTEVHCFASKDSRVDFRLSLHARIKLPELRAIKSHLRPGNYLAEQLERRTIEATREEIRKISPECLHTHFSEELAHGHSDEPGGQAPPCKPAPERRVEAAIRQSVSKHFIEPSLQEQCSVEVDALTVTVHPTELTDIYSAVRPPLSHQLEIVAESRSRMGESLRIELGYRVLGIAYGRWARFEETARTCQTNTVQEKGREIVAAIDQMLGVTIREKAEELPPAWLRSARPDVRDQVKYMVCRDACESVVRHFGLAVEITHFRRAASGWDVKAQQLMLAKHEDTEQQLTNLRTLRRTRVLELGPDDPEVESLRQQIRDLESQLEAEFSSGTDEDFKGAEALPGSYDWQRLLDRTREDAPLLPAPPASSEND